MDKELRKLIVESNNLHTGMKADESKSQYAVWKNKEVLDSRLLFSFDNTEHVTHEMKGSMELSDRILFNGHKTLRMYGDNRQQREEKKLSFTDWPDNTNLIRLDTQYMDLRGYNRVSMWVYADMPTRPNAWIYFVLCNKDGGSIDRSGLDSRTGFSVPTNRWHQVFWEFDHHERDSVREFVIAMQPEGCAAGDDPLYSVYFADLKAEKVEADYVDGWELQDRIAYNQTGFLPNGPKTAAAQGSEGLPFTLHDVRTGQAVYEKMSETVTNDLGTYQKMDFTEFTLEGEYVLKIGDKSTHPFRIAEDVLYSPIWKTINFFERERCGVEVPGTHGPCGMTDYLEHPDGHKLLNAGGWHDAGDLCQELCTTCDGITAMLELIKNLGTKEPELKARTKEEVRHGLDWVLRSTFRDGYYALMSGHMNWDGFILKAKKEEPPFFNSCVNFSLGHWFRAGALAEAYRTFRDEDDWYARFCLEEAKEDFAFGLEAEKTEGQYKVRMGNTASHELQNRSRKGFAAVQLYLATGDESYLQEAAGAAQIVMACQQTELPAWERPLRGFFYCDREKKEIAQYEHQSAEQAPIYFLVHLCEAAPQHPDAKKWRGACELYAGYILDTADVMEPFSLLPAAVYDLNTRPMERMLQMEGEEYVLNYYRESIMNGIKLSDTAYLRRFPISSSLLKGFFAPIYAKAAAAAELARLLDDERLHNIAIEQMGWIFGKNPFARSDMYGEGYGFQPHYTPFSLDMVGSIPVGIQTNGTKDAPFYPSNNRPTFNEVWIHAASRFLMTAASLVYWVK